MEIMCVLKYLFYYFIFKKKNASVFENICTISYDSIALYTEQGRSITCRKIRTVHAHRNALRFYD